MAYEMEMTHRVYSNDGFFYELRPDPDGLGIVELRYFEDVDDKEPKQSVTLTAESIPLIIRALTEQLTQAHRITGNVGI